jgi:hypothetical protein
LAAIHNESGKLIHGDRKPSDREGRPDAHGLLRSLDLEPARLV